MKLLPLSILVPILVGCLSRPVLAQCEGPSVFDFKGVGSLGSFEDGRMTYMSVDWSLRAFVPAFDSGVGTWEQSDLFFPIYEGLGLFPKIPLGFAHGSDFVVGLPENGDVMQGEVHIRDGSGQLIELEGSEAEAADGFGEGLAMHGDLLVVGASMAFFDFGACGPGKAYIFEREAGTWVEKQILRPHDFGDGVVARYGYFIDTDGETIVIGSPGDGFDSSGTPTEGPGAAYVYEKGPSGWLEVAKLFPSNPTPGAWFGRDVAVLGDQILIGAPEAGAGAVYAFQRGPAGWQETQILTPSVGAPFDAFGQALDIEHTRAIVGSPGVDGALNNVGAVYVIELDGSGHWTEIHRLVATGEGAFAALGGDVLIDGNQILWSGSSSRIYYLSLGIDGAVNFCTSTPNSSGAAAVLAASGCDSRIMNALTLEASSLPANAMGLFFYGPRAAQYPLGNGFMCVGAGRRRLAIDRADAAGVMRSTLDFRSPQASRIQPGATWYFQAYYRDRFTGAGFDFSDGLSVEIRY